MLLEHYTNLLQRRTYWVLALVLLFIALAVPFVKDFRLDISTDSLVLENDEDLKYYRAIRARYSSDDFVVVTYRPDEELFTGNSLVDLRKLHDELEAVEHVDSVVSILNVPLLHSPPLTFAELKEDFRTLESEKTDLELAQKELQESPLYKHQLMSTDGKTTVLQVIFEKDEAYEALRQARDSLREIQLERDLTAEEVLELEKRSNDFLAHKGKADAKQEKIIKEVRLILDRYRESATIHLSGVPMIVVDMIEFIRHDLRVFGVGVVIAIALLLALIFHRVRFVVLPLLTSFITIVLMFGILGFLKWPVTVVSSNFVSLLLIFSTSLCVHLIVSYQELAHDHPEASGGELVQGMIRDKFAPCFFTILTTIVAFGSLVVSGIRPVVNFGWMMSIGLSIALVVSFTFFPAMLLLLKRISDDGYLDITGRITERCAQIVEKHGTAILFGSGTLAVLCVYGMSLLTVDNRFIDYFKRSTEIFQGMEFIDNELGGTIPLDVILDAPADFEPVEEDPFDEDFGEESEQSLTETSYWFNEYMLDYVRNVEEYLDGRPETGKVLSLNTGLEVVRSLNDGENLQTFELGVLYKRLPPDTKKTLVDPYLSDDGKQVRFSIRLNESMMQTNRDQFLSDVRANLIKKFKFAPEEVRLTGMAVLFNNMLQSLFQSQILTLGVVLLAITVVFAFIFRSLYVAILSILPNALSAILVLGIMGIVGLPLDMMTITIAAITVGIAVDDTIHYIHRFEHEIKEDGDYHFALHRSHNTIGRAMYYTSITIMIGFFILVFSNFNPTMYFGVLTGLAMFSALIANLILLPALLVRARPYGKGKS